MNGKFAVVLTLEAPLGVLEFAITDVSPAYLICTSLEESISGMLRVLVAANQEAQSPPVELLIHAHHVAFVLVGEPPAFAPGFVGLQPQSRSTPAPL